MLKNNLSALTTLLRNRLIHPGNAPRLLTHTVTFRCNARCIMCDSWKKNGKDDLTIAEIERIYQQLPTLDAVRLTGGEPFVRQDFAEIAQLATDILRPALLHITTNGFLTSAITRFLENRDKKIPLHLLVSVDGIETTHDKIRGIQGAFARTRTTIEEVLAHAQEWNVLPAVNQTIVDAQGFEEYQTLHALLEPWKISHQVVIAYAESATYSENREKNLAPTYPGQFQPLHPLPPSTLEPFLQQLQLDYAKASLTHRLPKMYYTRGIANRLLHKEAKPNPPCAALGPHLRLFPNGDVPVCQFNGNVVGNLRECDFADLWQSAEHRKWRRWVQACPGCWAECEILPSAFYSGDLFRRHP